MSVAIVSCEDPEILTWDKTYEFDDWGGPSNLIMQSSDGGYLTAGSNGQRIALVKVDEAGITQWSKLCDAQTNYWESSGDYSIRQVADKYLLALIASNEQGVILRRISEDGTDAGEITVRTDHLFNDIFTLSLTAENGVVVVGSDTNNFIIARFDQNGDRIWETRAGISSSEPMPYITSEFSVLE